MPTSSADIAHKRMIHYLRFEQNCDSKVVDVMERLPRELFLPENSDLEHFKPIPIGYEQTMSAPYIVASMTALLEISGYEKILEIGSGCGYQTAVLMGMGAQVYSVEYIPELAEMGRRNLIKIGLNPDIECGDGFFGRPANAPFQRILIAATAPVVPQNLLHQLDIGGFMVLPLQGRDKQYMTKIHKISNHEHRIEWLYGVIFVPFVGEIRKSRSNPNL